MSTPTPADFFFQCLICNSFLGSLWKVQKHVERHEDDDKNTNKKKVEGDEGGNNDPTNPKKTDDAVPVRRRGMLPIRKVAFNVCFVPLVKAPVPLGGLGSRGKQQKESASNSKEELILKGRRRGRPKGSRSKVESTLLKLGTRTIDRTESSDEDDNIGNLDPIANTSGRLPRRCRLRAVQKLKQVSEILLEEHDSLPDEARKEPSPTGKSTGFSKYYHDDEFRPPNSIPREDRVKKLKASNSKKIPSSSLAETSGEGPKRRKRRRKRKPHEDFANPVKCEHCSVTYPNQKLLAEHIVEKHKEKAKVIMCPISTCKTPTLNSHWLAEHLTSHVNAERKELLHSNPNPDEKIRPLEKYNSSHYYHSSSFHCKLCLAKECSMETLKNHQINSHAECNLKCSSSNCENDSGFNSNVIAFINHVRIFHPTELNPHNEHQEKRKQYSYKNAKILRCDKCQYSCNNQKRLEEHVAAKHAEKPARYDNMDDEEYTRSRPFPCPVCKRRFLHKYHLRRHFHSHLENNPYVCDFPECNRKFNSPYNLKRHTMLHDTSRQSRPRVICRLQCPICKLYFHRKDRIVKHFRTVHNPNGTTADPGSSFRIARLGITNVPAATLLSEDQASDSNSNPSEPNDDIIITADESVPILEPQIKHEPNDHFSSRRTSSKLKVKTEIAGEIHLVDRIVLDKDGTAVHIKGEHLSPETPSEADSQTLERVDPITSRQEKVSDKTWTPKANDRARTTSDTIMKDPVFQRILDKDSTVLEFVRPRGYSYHSGKSFTCSECKEVFSRAWTLQLHMKSQHKKTIVEELFAGKSGNPGSNLNQEIVTMCGICAYPAKSKGDMASHMKKAHPQGKLRRSWKCRKEGCCSTFETQRALFHHIKQLHSDNASRNFHCQFCKKTFLTKITVKHHETKVHQGRANGEKQKKKCPKCPAILAPSTYPHHMRKHMNEEKGVEKPKCMLCHDTFSCRMSLQRHIDGIHLGKPLNKINYAKSRKKKAGGAGKGRKKVEEWFDPLLKKIIKPNKDASKGTEERQAKRKDTDERDGGLESDAILGL